MELDTMQDYSISAAPGEFSSPLFIMGCMRSGTTLLSDLLSNHSRIAIFRESFFCTLFHPILHYYGDLSQRSNLRYLIRDVLEAMGWKEVDERGFEEALTAPTLSNVFGTLLNLYAGSQGKMRGGDKTPDHHNYLPYILEDFPESPIIFIVRDPRDTVFSIKKAFGGSIDGSALLWNSAFLNYSRNRGQVHLVRYEELVREPAETLKAVCSFIGESYEPGMLRFYERNRERTENIRHHHTKLLEPINPGSIGNFRLMSPLEIERIEYLCSEGMEALGYPFTNGRKPLKSSGRDRPHTSLNFFQFVIDKLSYYRLNPGRWKGGWRRWKLVAVVRIRYWMSLRSLRGRNGE